MKKYILIIGSVLLSMGSIAQNRIDALRYSKMQYLGTARFNAMGGAFTALGGDNSAIIINPAAIGIYRSSELSITPSLLLNDLETNYRGQSLDENTNIFNIGNIGYVASYPNDPNGWRYASFGIGHNRISNFHGDYTYKGVANAAIEGSTIIDGYIKTLNSYGANEGDVANYLYPFGPSQAYMTFMIDTISGNYIRDTGLQQADEISQYERNYVKGKQSETYFSFGGNYMDKLFLGANIAFQHISYHRVREYNEAYSYPFILSPTDTANSSPYNYFEKSEQHTTGSGVNLKIGAIYKITDEFRVGASIHTPTWIEFDEEYSHKANSDFTVWGHEASDQVISTFQYQINTPWRYNLGASYLIGSRAALSVDYEFVNYGSARIKDNYEFPYDYSDINTDIKDQLKSTHNIRAGAEVNLAPFVIRAGYRYEDNPLSKSSLNLDESRQTYSLGTGFRSGNFAIDLTYMQSNMSFADGLYPENNENATANRTDSQIMLSLGWRW